ncbi:ankyrin repeat domain-containing protein 36C-like [Trichomycterus rosablanca]|uniref:ankyrin repeat domain-containing protein 36C-like n=1 Tax=Trichomycterus rosablanca TaxID=2290929 RepID=UPI002F35E539
MDPLDNVSDEELVAFLRCNKTWISCMEDPGIFLTQLRDHDLVPEDLYQEVMMIDCKDKLQKGVYQILEWVEKNQKQSIKKFWNCVFKNHIRLKYSTLQSLRASLLDGLPSGSNNEIGNAQKPIKKKNNPTQKSRKTPKDGKTNKIKKGVEKTGQKKPGLSSFINLKQKKPAKETELSLLTSRKNTSATKVIKSKKPLIKKQKKTANERTIAELTKELFEKMQKEEPGPSSSVIPSQKKTAKKVTFALLTAQKNPSAKKVIKSKKPLIKKQKRTANKKTIAELTKELLKKMEKEEPGPSSSVIPSQKKPAKKVTFAAGLKPEKMTKEKKTGIKRKKTGEETEKEKPGPSITVNIQMKPAISQTLCLNQEEMTKKKKTGIKRKNSDKEAEEEKPGPSSLVTNNQMKPAMTQTQLPSLKKEEKQNMEIHVTCGDKTGMLYREKLVKAPPAIVLVSRQFAPCITCV